MPKQVDLENTRRSLTGYSDDQLIGAAELAALLSTTVGMVYRYLYINPAALPPAMQGFGRKRVWHLGTCRRWVRDRAAVGTSPSPDSPETKRTGRPRSTESGAKAAR
jgi:hypothetical protein